MNVQALYSSSRPADEIIPGLWLGNKVAAGDQNFSKINNVRAVFNCSKDIPFNATIPRQYRIPVDDSRQEPSASARRSSCEILYTIS